MSKIIITLIDVGWGDSILIESIDSYNNETYALIDSNDTSNYRSSLIFLKRHFEKKGDDISLSKPIFKYIFLSHAHTDHGQGLKSIMREFGTDNFFYPKSFHKTMLAELIRFANRSSNVGWHQGIDADRDVDSLGDVEIEVMWPEYDTISFANENNNSLVLKLELGDHSLLLTGDPEGEVWDEIANSIPSYLAYFKVPHHGSVNGAFFDCNPCWTDEIDSDVKVAISSHIHPYDHPHERVINLLKDKNHDFYRTDESYHLIFEFDDQTNIGTMKYSHQ